MLRQRRRLLLLQLELGADRWEVARPYSAWGKFFGKKFKDRVTTRGSLTRPPTLATVGGRCLQFTKMEELSSSSAQRAASTSRRFGGGDCLELERIRILCDVAKGRATEEQRPSPVTRPPARATAWPGVTTRPQSTPCGPPHDHGALDCPGRLQHLLLLARLIYKQSSTQLQPLWWCYSSCS